MKKTQENKIFCIFTSIKPHSIIASSSSIDVDVVLGMATADEFVDTPPVDVLWVFNVGNIASNIQQN